MTGQANSVIQTPIDTYIGMKLHEPDAKPPGNPVLLACPFCGKDPEWAKTYTPRMIQIICQGCCVTTKSMKTEQYVQSSGTYSVEREVMLELAQSWNRRTTQPKPTLPKRDLIRFFREGKSPTWGDKPNEQVDAWIEDVLKGRYYMTDGWYQDSSDSNKDLCELRARHNIRLFQDMGHYFLAAGGQIIGHLVTSKP